MIPPPSASPQTRAFQVQGPGSLFPEQFAPLLEACQQLTSYRQRLARPKLESAICDHVHPGLSNGELLAHIFAEAIMRRLDEAMVESKNIYVEQFDIPQITMFYKMARAYPHIAACHSIANQYLYQELRGLEEATLLDIGIGQGDQVRNLLMSLAMGEEHRGLRRLNVIGVDPSKENLEVVRKLLEVIQRKVPYTLNYLAIPRPIEDVPLHELLEIQRRARGTLLINSSLALHHIRPLNGNHALRTGLLRLLRALEPRLITLIEPNVDHHTEDLVQRFINCWEHFSQVFELIDESTVSVDGQFTIKEKFFGREIRDIFGASDDFRSERHETCDAWLLRLRRAGFSPYAFEDIIVNLPEHSSAKISEGLVRLCYGKTMLLAVMAYTSDPMSASGATRGIQR